MQDAVLGYVEFDEKFIVKTNSELKTATLFADDQLRRILLAYEDLSFGIVDYALEENDDKVPFLELKIQAGITDPALLREIYTVFMRAVQILD